MGALTGCPQPGQTGSGAGEVDQRVRASDEQRDLYNNIALAAFLVGGAVGGVLFGTLSDRVGRKRVMTYTILVYSLFTALHPDDNPPSPRRQHLDNGD